MPAFGGDKCPFLHNGRGLYLGHVEDMTKFMFWHQHPILPRKLKSENNNYLLIACEMKKESHGALKVRLCNCWIFLPYSVHAAVIELLVCAYQRDETS